MVLYDIEDGGSCDGEGAAGCVDRLFLDGVEVVGAFDELFTPGAGPTPAHTAVFEIPHQWSLLRDGMLSVLIDTRPCCGATRRDAIWVDWSELEVATPLPAPTTIGLFMAGMLALTFQRHRGA